MGLCGTEQLKAHDAGVSAEATVEGGLTAAAAVDERDGVAERFEDPARMGCVGRAEGGHVTGVEEGDRRHRGIVDSRMEIVDWVAVAMRGVR
jgi:hypothetical protein